MSAAKKLAKIKAWKEFSRYIRLRDSDCYGIAECRTCGDKKHWKQVHAGHFLAGRGESILFEETGCHAQCPICNMVLDGNFKRYKAFIALEYGVGEVNRLERLKGAILKRSASDYNKLAREFREKADNLASLLMQ